MFVVEQKTAYEMRISDWSSDVCSSDLRRLRRRLAALRPGRLAGGDDRLSHHPRLLRRLHDPAVAGLHARHLPEGAAGAGDEIGRASCRERVCQYVYISGGVVCIKKQINRKQQELLRYVKQSRIS